MLTTYFSFNQVLLLLAVAILHVISLYCFSFNKNIKYALYFLFAGGLLARLAVISFDDYLHLWDEQYHALIAKNMAENSFVPMLFKYTPLEYSPTNWTENHIWLHKQPWFLWQIALSIKMFGASPFAVRLPSAIMTTLLILVIYRIGKITISDRVGYISAFLYATCNYLLDFNTGQYNTDHNDLAFIFYVTLSFWAYTEYRISHNRKFIWFIGMFVGIAVLNKWLTGLLVFSGWGISILFYKTWTEKITEAKALLQALGICILIFLPWQIYVLTAFPVESHAEYEYNGRHLFEALEGHGGDWLYHLDQAIMQYGPWFVYLLPLALIMLCVTIKNISLRVSFIVFALIPYVFFTIVKTKMPAFCLVAMSILFLSMGNFLYGAFEYLKKRIANDTLYNSIVLVILLVIGTLSFDIEKLQLQHTFWKENDLRAIVTRDIIKATEIGRSIAGKYDEKSAVVINCKETGNIPIMFFSGYTAYSRIPSDAELDQLTKNGYKPLYLDDILPVPDNIEANPNVTIINTINKNQKQVYLKANNGKFVCADGSRNNSVVADRDKAGDWEKFTISIFEDQCIIRAYNKRFLCPELNGKGEVGATREAVGPWEKFSITKLDDTHFAFKAANGKYLTIDEATSEIFARANTIGKNGIFEIMEIGK